MIQNTLDLEIGDEISRTDLNNGTDLDTEKSPLAQVLIGRYEVIDISDERIRLKTIWNPNYYEFDVCHSDLSTEEFTIGPRPEFNRWPE